MKIAAQHTRWYRQQFEYFTTVCVLGKRSVVCNAEPCKIQKAKTKMTKMTLLSTKCNMYLDQTSSVSRVSYLSAGKMKTNSVCLYYVLLHGRCLPFTVQSSRYFILSSRTGCTVQYSTVHVTTAAALITMISFFVREVISANYVFCNDNRRKPLQTRVKGKTCFVIQIQVQTLKL